MKGKILGAIQLIIGLNFLGVWLFAPVEGVRFSLSSWMELLLAVFVIATSIPNLKSK